MKKQLTWPLFLALALLVVYAITTVLLHQFLSGDRLRLMLVEPVEARLGRQIEIGSIKVSLFSGIDITHIKVHGLKADEDFISIANFRLVYKLLPLLENKLVITEAAIDRPSLNISRNRQGAYNFADIVKAPENTPKDVPPPDQQTVEPIPLSLAFDKITISGINLTFRDQTGALPDIDSSTGNLSLAVTLAPKLVDSQYHGTLNLIVNSEYKGHKPVLILDSNINDQEINFKGNLSVEFQKLYLRGKLTKPLSTPDLTLDVQSNSLDLEKLAPVPANPVSDEPAATDLDTATPQEDATPDQNQREAASAPQPATDATTAPAAPAASAASTAPAAPADLPGNFLLHGNINIAELHSGHFAAQKINLEYAFDNRTLTLDKITATLYSGELNGRLTAGLGQPAPQLQGNVEITGMRLGDAMAALGKPAGYLSGSLSADLTFQGAGQEWPAIRDTLSGEGKFSLVKGGLAGFPFSQALATILEMPKLNDLQFAELAGNLEIAKGRVAILANLSSEALDLHTQGSVGLDGSVDLPLIVMLSKENSQRLQGIPKFAGYPIDENGRTTLNLKMSGTFDHPELALAAVPSPPPAKKMLKNEAGAAGHEAGAAVSRNIDKEIDNRSDARDRETVKELSDHILKQLQNK